MRTASVAQTSRATVQPKAATNLRCRANSRRCSHAHLAPTIARALLDGQTSDPTKGATHFYTPRAMPKKGENTGGADVGGKLESVPGVVTRDKPPRPIENYRPSFAGGKSFNEIQVPNVQAKDFKFFRKAGDGPVR